MGPFILIAFGGLRLPKVSELIWWHITKPKGYYEEEIIQRVLNAQKRVIKEFTPSIAEQMFNEHSAEKWDDV